MTATHMFMFLVFTGENIELEETQSWKNTEGERRRG